MLEKRYDAEVLIVGGGPSGSLCAYYLAKAGKKVILIDSENFPRDKICGDFVSPIGLNELIKIGIDNLDDFHKTNIIKEATLYLDGEPLITKEFPNIEGLTNYGRVIPRKILDNWIIEEAKKQGALIITPCKLRNYTVFDNEVTVGCIRENKIENFSVKILIGADGSNSFMASMMNGNKPKTQNRIMAVRAYFEDINCDCNKAELFFSSSSFPGYSWFFPIGNNRANVGVGMTEEIFPRNKVSLKELLLNTIEKDKALKARIGNGKLIDKISAWPLSIYNPNAAIVGYRVLLTGDAAGLIHSLNGEGIQYALQSGRWAAESVIKCLENKDLIANSLKMYDTKVRCEIGYDMSIANIIMQITRNRNLNPMYMGLLKVIVAKASHDEQYANIAGGTLAGMLPINKVLTISFLGKTFIKSISLAFSSFFKPFKIIRQDIGFIFKILYNSLWQKKEYLKWSIGLVKSIIIALKLKKNKRNFEIIIN